ncbi:MAG: signal peptide peptidase SppA [Planctomycetales bacterium]|nr:signal peptide peptidase SppA [Planctomycetales bacterium]
MPPEGPRANPSERPIQPELVNRPAPPPPPQSPTVIINQTGGTGWKVLAWLGWTGLLLCLPILFGLLVARSDYFDQSGGIQERYHSLSKTGSDKIAVIQITGTIMDGEGYVKSQIDRVRSDDNVKAVVVRVNSPGGTVTGSDYIYHHLTKLRDERELPLVVSMGGLAASGGYYVSMAVGNEENTIFAEPTTTTGSIGVIFPHYDVSGLLERFDIKNDSIVSHPRKQLASMTKEMSPEDRAILQGYVDQSFARFKEIVLSGRPKLREDADALDNLATGEIFTAEQALAGGLIDQIGFVEEAIERAIELAELDADSVRVVTYSQPPSLFGVMSASAADQSLEATLLNLSVPRACYLYTTLPNLLGD